MYVFSIIAIHFPTPPLLPIFLGKKNKQTSSIGEYYT
jgi:hypothetical protein